MRVFLEFFVKPACSSLDNLVIIFHTAFASSYPMKFSIDNLSASTVIFADALLSLKISYNALCVCFSLK